MKAQQRKEYFMHLAYLDDSGTRDKNSRFQLMTAVVIEGWEFAGIEQAFGTGIDLLVAEERLERFEEFHAYELYGGYGVFEGVEQDKRFSVIRGILRIAKEHTIPVIYGAVDLVKLADKNYGSADPLDTCFRICAKGIDEWAAKQFQMPAANDPDPLSTVVNGPHPLVVLVADDFQQKSIKETLRKSFQYLRKPLRPPDFYDNRRTQHLHDALYFGNSKDSGGLQLADLCAYIIRKHLEGDESVAGFYDIFKDQIAFHKIEPQD